MWACFALPVARAIITTRSVQLQPVHHRRRSFSSHMSLSSSASPRSLLRPPVMHGQVVSGGGNKDKLAQRPWWDGNKPDSPRQPWQLGGNEAQAAASSSRPAGHHRRPATSSGSVSSRRSSSKYVED